MGFADETPVVAGTVLVRSAIQSPDYVAGVSGWAIFQNGAVEFNNATIRGSLIAGGGAVTLDATGLTITGGGRIMTIDTTGQFKVVRTNGDGAYGQLTMFTSASTRGGAVVVQSIDPTPAGNDINGAVLYSDLGGVIADEIPLAVVESQYFTGKGAAFIYLGGQSSGSGVDNSFVKVGAASLVVGDAVTCTTTTNGPVTVGGTLIVNGSASLSGSLTNSTDSMTYLRGQRFTVNVTNASVSAFTQVFNFPVAFPVGVVPNVHVNINDGSGATLKAIANAISVTNTSYTLRCRSGDGTAMGAWAAVPVQVTAIV